MAVFTEVSEGTAQGLLDQLKLGALQELRGIQGGIENTNYFVTTTSGRFVLTLFEKLTAEELPFYLRLMAHLAHHGVPCPSPMRSRARMARRVHRLRAIGRSSRMCLFPRRRTRQA